MQRSTRSQKEAASLAQTAFERHYRDLHRYLVRRLPRAQDANDLIQEVFLRILRLNCSEFVRQPQAYVYGIASHVIHEFRMRGGREQITFNTELLEHTAEHPHHAASDEAVDQLISESDLERALFQLPATHRAVLLLHKRDGLSREEVARELGLSVHTVKKYIFQAMAQIRANWDQ